MELNLLKKALIFLFFFFLPPLMECEGNSQMRGRPQRRENRT